MTNGSHMNKEQFLAADPVTMRVVRAIEKVKIVDDPDRIILQGKGWDGFTAAFKSEGRREEA